MYFSSACQPHCYKYSLVSEKGPAEFNQCQWITGHQPKYCHISKLEGPVLIREFISPKWWEIELVIETQKKNQRE